MFDVWEPSSFVLSDEPIHISDIDTDEEFQETADMIATTDHIILTMMGITTPDFGE